jgi:phosphopantothenoylcysteine synthetase/decarboxylase
MKDLSILKNKKIIFGISGSISAYKACDIVNILTKN